MPDTALIRRRHRVGLLSKFLEMEFTDAIVVGFLTFVAKAAVVMVLVLMLV